MMLNLFSIFDPSSSIMSMPLNWSSIGLGCMILPWVYWTILSRYLMIFKMIERFMVLEMTLLLTVEIKSHILMFISLFMFIMMNNSFGLLPYVFTASSHLVFTLSLALPMWLGYFMYGWVNNMTNMLAHLVPQGTPSALMFFMVIIESISNLIRPLTLAVRLAANMIAGHLLLALMSGAISALSLTSVLGISMSQITLLILESAVAIIQAYVFAILSTLYVSEV